MEERHGAVFVVGHVDRSGSVVQADVARPSSGPGGNHPRAAVIGDVPVAGSPVDHGDVGVDDARDVHGVGGRVDGHVPRESADGDRGWGLAAAGGLGGIASGAVDDRDAGCEVGVSGLDDLVSRVRYVHRVGVLVDGEAVGAVLDSYGGWGLVAAGGVLRVAGGCVDYRDRVIALVGDVEGVGGVIERDGHRGGAGCHSGRRLVAA